MTQIFPKSLRALLIGVLTCTSLSAQEQASEQPKPPKFTSDIEAFETWDAKNSFPEDAALFIGSSSIRMWETAKAFPDMPVINRGFGGSQFEHLLFFYDRIVPKYHPRAVLIYSGDNDLAVGDTPEQILAEASELVERIHRDLPDAWVVILSTKPSPLRIQLLDSYVKLNGKLEDYAGKDPRRLYVDLASPICDANGQPRPELFRDTIHLTAEGYEIWNDVVDDVLEKVLHESPPKHK